MKQSLVQAWLQAHGLFTLAPARLQRVSARLAKEGITNEDLDLLWQHAVDTGAERPDALLVGSLDGNWKLAVESVKAIDRTVFRKEPEPEQYPGDVVPRKGRLREPREVICNRCDVPGVRALDEKIICPKCGGALADPNGNIHRDAGPWEPGK